MMKKTSLLLLVVAVLMSSCSSKMKTVSAEYFTVTPSVLEVVGSEIPVTIDGKFPAKFFNKNSVLTITPVLKYEGGEAMAEPVTFQGEKVRGNDRAISYEDGGTFRMKMQYGYVPAMEDAELYLRFDVAKGSKTYTIPEVKIADGCVATSQLYRRTAAMANIAVGEDAFQRVIKQAKEANIMFLIQQTNLRTSELNSTSMTELREALKDVATDYENKVLEDIKIAAFASPDGGMSLNDGIAVERERNTANYMKNELKKVKLEGLVESEYTAEDWDGFKELVAQSTLPDKDLILRVLSMYTDPEEREQQIKNISTVYSELADEVLPKLRRARVTLNYQIIGRSDDEILAQYAADPGKLSLEEILYMTILTEDEAEKVGIYNTAIELYPNDYRAYNNLGVIAFRKADYDTAADYFAKAESVDAAAPEVMINLGYLELLKGNVDEAEAYIAKGAGSKAGDEALGNLYIAQGKYDAAAALLEGSKTNSTLLAHVLVENYVEARETLEAIKNPDAVTHYIKAVLGARTNNVVLLYDGLKEAISLEPELAQKAKVDLEFAKFANTETFLDILK